MASKQPSSLVRSSSVVSLLNLVSRVTGFLREMIRARYLGTSSLSDAFQLAFSIPNLFRRLTAEGVMLSSFLPIFGEIHHRHGKKEAEDFYFAIFWCLLLLLGGLTVLFIYFADFFVGRVFASGFQGETLETTIFLSRIMFGYIFFISLAALFQGVLNHHRIFWVSAITPIFLNFIVIFAGIVAGYFLANVALAFSYGVLVGGIVQALFQAPYVARLGYKVFRKASLRNPYVKKTLQVSLPGILGAGIYQIDIVISNVIATGLVEGSLSALGFSNRLLELTLGVFVVSQTTVLLPHIVRCVQKEEYQQASQDLTATLGLVCFFTLPMLFGMLVCGETIVRLLFEGGEFDDRAVALTVQALSFHLPGIVAIGWNRTLITAFQAKQKFYLTMFYALCSSLTNLSLSYGLSRSLGNGGIALANSLSQALLCFFFLFFLQQETGVQVYWKKLLQKSLLKQALAVGMMLAGIFAVRFLMPVSHLRFFLEVSVAGILYLSVNFLLKTPEMASLVKLLNKDKNVR